MCSRLRDYKELKCSSTLVPTESRHTRPGEPHLCHYRIPSAHFSWIPMISKNHHRCPEALRAQGSGVKAAVQLRGLPASAPRWAPTTAPSPSFTRTRGKTRLAVCFSSPPAVGTQLRVNLHHVSFQQGQFSHVSCGEVVASDGDA